MFILFTAEEIEDRDKKIDDLIYQMSLGDKDAIGKLYELISDIVYAYALSKMKDTHDAEDVMHDTFVKIFRYASRYVKQGKPMAWIFTIEINIIKRHKELKGRHISYDESIGEDVPCEVSAEENLIKSDLVSKMLNVLDEAEREIVILHAVSGLKHREIASLIGIPLATVLSKYSRAIKKIQKEMEEEL